MTGLFCVIAINTLLLFSKPANGNRAAPFVVVPVSNDLMAVKRPERAVTIAPVQVGHPFRINNYKVKNLVSPDISPSIANYISTVINNPDIVTANYETLEVPKLNKYEEAQVKEAMEASRKILENIQWKAVEKSIADVFNQKEKEEIKAGYEKEIAKIDWDKWEINLKQVYDKIDWDKINTQFSTALNQVRMDSIQVVYNKAIRKLDIVRKELRQSGLKGIPDSDITLKELEQKKNDVQKALLKLNADRSKKIVHL